MIRDLKALIAQMTLEEKASLCSGEDFWHTAAVERLGIPAMMMSDGPHGLRKQEGTADHMGLNESIKAVCFPAACATASSFDPDLMERLGETLGEECQAENIGVLLGPAINMKRSPLCGRNFEYMSEDPYLTGKLSAAYIRGVQRKGVGTSIKHFAVNNQETRRMSVSSEVSERAFHEIYLPAFEEAMKAAKPWTVMCSYNKINGTFASENRELLTDILRRDWGYEGFVVSDWGAVNDRVKGLQAGLDLEMPASQGYNDRKIIRAVQEGTLEEAVLDETVERILKVVFAYADARRPETVFVRERDHEKAVEIEAQCAVLLENQGMLPLKGGQKIVYIGEYAEKPRFQGGGSSHINTDHVTSALETARKKGRNVQYVKGFAADKDGMSEGDLQAAVSAAREADAVVIFAGLPDSFESEGADRISMKLPACQDRLIAEIAAVQKHTAVVLHNGSPVETPWADQVEAILEMYLGGEGVGEACDQLLYGEVNPSGHLAETFPLRLEDNPSYLFFPGDGRKAFYGEDIFIGYRYYQSKKVPVRWAFGHGLSYTEFAWSNLRLDREQMNEADTMTISLDVENVGKMAGAEVAQLYVSAQGQPIIRPLQELKGFEKIFLQPGEKKTVTFTLKARDLSYYEEVIHDWYAPAGKYAVRVGSASDDIRGEASFQFSTTRSLPFTVDMNTTMGEIMAHPKTGPVMAAYMKPVVEQAAQAGDQDEHVLVTNEIINQMPLRSFMSITPGEAIESMIQALNAAVDEN